MFARIAAAAPPAFSRALGTSVRGPKITDLDGQRRLALDFFTGPPALNYYSFKARCAAVRIFAMPAVAAFFGVLLIVDPPRSSCWRQWAPWRVPVNFLGLFSASEQAFVYADEDVRPVNGCAIATEMIATRRIPGAKKAADELDDE